MAMTVKQLMKKLKDMPQDAEVWLQDAGTSVRGSDLTGTMWTNPAEAEDVREIKEGVMICLY